MCGVCRICNFSLIQRVRKVSELCDVFASMLRTQQKGPKVEMLTNVLLCVVFSINGAWHPLALVMYRTYSYVLWEKPDMNVLLLKGVSCYMGTFEVCVHSLKPSTRHTPPPGGQGDCWRKLG